MNIKKLLTFFYVITYNLEDNQMLRYYVTRHSKGSEKTLHLINRSVSDTFQRVAKHLARYETTVQVWGDTNASVGIFQQPTLPEELMAFVPGWVSIAYHDGLVFWLLLQRVGNLLVHQVQHLHNLFISLSLLKASVSMPKMVGFSSWALSTFMGLPWAFDIDPMAVLGTTELGQALVLPVRGVVLVSISAGSALSSFMERMWLKKDVSSCVYQVWHIWLTESGLWGGPSHIYLGSDT